MRSIASFHAEGRSPVDDIFLFICCAYNQLEIGDYKRDVRLVRPRYSALLAPAWVRDLRDSGRFWACRSLIDSSTTGDVCGAQWWIYAFGVVGSRLDPAPSAPDIRALRRGYTAAGLPCFDAPIGPTRVAGVGKSYERKVAILVDQGALVMGRFPHVPFRDTGLPVGANPFGHASVQK